MALSKQENGAPISIIAVNKTNSFKQQTHQLENTPTQELTNLATHQLTNPPTRTQLLIEKNPFVYQLSISNYYYCGITTSMLLAFATSQLAGVLLV